MREMKWSCGGNPGPSISSNGCRFRYELAANRKNPEMTTCPKCGHVDSLSPKSKTQEILTSTPTESGLAETPEDWGEIFITRDLEGLNKMAKRVVTRQWDDESNSETHAWVVDIEAAPDGDLILKKRRIDPVPWGPEKDSLK